MKYEIVGDTLPAVVCHLEEGEKMITQEGGMDWMSPNMVMETTTNGGFGKAIGRAFSGAKMFQNIYTSEGGPGMIAFASRFPGSIRAYDIEPGQEMILQKGAFMAAEEGVNFEIFFNKKASSGIFSGEGFIMQKFSGHGTAFAEFDGHIVEYDLKEGEKLVIDTGHVAAMTATCKMDVESVKGMKNKFFGGEEFFNTTVEGPGKVWLQTMPISKVAKALIPYLPSSSS